jgi:hypothetical protein
MRRHCASCCNRCDKVDRMDRTSDTARERIGLFGMVDAARGMLAGEVEPVAGSRTIDAPVRYQRDTDNEVFRPFVFLSTYGDYISVDWASRADESYEDRRVGNTASKDVPAVRLSVRRDRCYRPRFRRMAAAMDRKRYALPASASSTGLGPGGIARSCSFPVARLTAAPRRQRTTCGTSPVRVNDQHLATKRYGWGCKLSRATCRGKCANERSRCRGR